MNLMKIIADATIERLKKDEQFKDWSEEKFEELRELLSSDLPTTKEGVEQHMEAMTRLLISDTPKLNPLPIEDYESKLDHFLKLFGEEYMLLGMTQNIGQLIIVTNMPIEKLEPAVQKLFPGAMKVGGIETSRLLENMKSWVFLLENKVVSP